MRLPSLSLSLGHFQPFLRQIDRWNPSVFYGVITLITTKIYIFHKADLLADQFKSFFDSNEDTFDFIVVGAGSTGAVVAHRLSKDYRVLLLEAGGEPYPLSSVPGAALGLLNHPHVDWQFQTASQKTSCLAMEDHVCNWPRGKGLGGSSNLNFMQYARGHPSDYDNWANITGDSRWAYKNVLPYFKKSEDFQWTTRAWEKDPTKLKYHGRGGPLKVAYPPYTGMSDYFIRAGEEMGYPRIDVNAPYTEGFDKIVYTQDNGRRYGTFKAFIKEIRHDQNLRIYKFATVHRILLTENNKAIGVEYFRHGSLKRAFVTREVIVSAGAIMSPKILMLSGIGPKKHLESMGIRVRADLPVGQNLQDHITSVVGPWVINKPISLNPEREWTVDAMFDYANRGEGVWTTTGIMATAFIKSSFAKKDIPDLQFIFMGLSTTVQSGRLLEYALNLRRETLVKYLGPTEGKDSFQNTKEIMTILSRPETRGEILLTSPDPVAPLYIDPKYYENGTDIEVLIEGMKRAVELVERSKAFRSIGSKMNKMPFPGCENVPFGSYTYWNCLARHYSLTLFHPAGTCAMGRVGSKSAVLDSQLRVIGVKNLRVMDASVMPVLISSNTNAACIMIGEVGSDLLINEHRRQYSRFG